MRTFTKPRKRWEYDNELAKACRAGRQNAARTLRQIDRHELIMGLVAYILATGEKPDVSDVKRAFVGTEKTRNALSVRELDVLL